jgi:hypothetical protein
VLSFLAAAIAASGWRTMACFAWFLMTIKGGEGSVRGFGSVVWRYRHFAAKRPKRERQFVLQSGCD